MKVICAKHEKCEVLYEGISCPVCEELAEIYEEGKNADYENALQEIFTLARQALATEEVICLGLKT